MFTVHEFPLVETRVDVVFSHESEEVKLLYDMPPVPVKE
jgi:hypothetical protein